MNDEQKIIPFKDSWDESDIRAMDAGQLRACLEELEAVLARLDGKEPKNQNSEKYEAWAEEHEDLEDLIDEVLDRLDELGNQP